MVKLQPSSDEVSISNTTLPKPSSDEVSLLNPLVPSDEVSISNITLPRPYTIIWTKCNWTLNTCGSLYKKTKVDEIKKFMFDYKKDIAISVIATSLTMMWATPVVSVITLLAGLGVGVIGAFTTTSLNGYYDATRTLYSYYVTVDKKETYKHNQAKYVVKWYNTRNAKQYNRTQHSASWMSEEGILNMGIFAGS